MIGQRRNRVRELREKLEREGWQVDEAEWARVEAWANGEVDWDDGVPPSPTLTQLLDRDPGRPARGIVIGCALGLAVWAMLGLMVWEAMR